MTISPEADAGRLLFDHNPAIAFLARVDCHLPALATDFERYKFIEAQLVRWLTEVNNDRSDTMAFEIAIGLIDRRRSLGSKLGF